MRVPHVLHADDFTFFYSCNMQRDADGNMTTARPESGPGLLGIARLRAAWLVFVGRADAVQWGYRPGSTTQTSMRVHIPRTS